MSDEGADVVIPDAVCQGAGSRCFCAFCFTDPIPFSQDIYAGLGYQIHTRYNVVQIHPS